ncbi:MAG: hypothetical protein M5U29_02515 [Anaerolineae bacterium]|nr:hypothetical protein [Anaerolineae bacterium]
MTNYLSRFPRFFVVDFDVYVKLENQNGTIVGSNHVGHPYPVGKALGEGHEITEDEFNTAVEHVKNQRKDAQAPTDKLD